MDIYQKNLKIIEAKYPDLYKRLSAVESDWEVTSSRHGPATIRQCKKYLHSRYDPFEEAKQFIDRQEIKEDQTWIVCGLALGYHVVELLKKVKRYNLLLVIEKDINVFAEAIKTIDFSEILDNFRIILFVGMTATEIYDDLATRSLSFICAGFSVLEWKASVALDAEYFSQITQKLKDLIRIGIANIMTVQFSGRRMIQNTMNNMPYIFQSEGVKKLEGVAKGYAGIIVSAGPSLNKNIHYLKEAKGKIFIVSTDTALRILLKNGIEPDLVVTMDFKAESAKHFKGLNTDHIPLVFDSESAHESILEYNGPKISSLSARPFSLWVAHIGGNKGLLSKGMSVAHTVFNLLLMMKCEQIIFVGQDLSFPNGKTHADGTHSQQDANGEKKELFWVESEVTGERLLTRNDMYIYLKLFEKMVRDVDVHCVNATEGGLGIKGTEGLTLKEAVKKYSNNESRVSEIIAELNIENVHYDKEGIVEKINELINEFSDLRKASKNIVVELEKLLKAISKTDELDKTIIRKSVARTQKDLAQIRTLTHCLNLIYSEFVDELMQMQREGELSVMDIEKYSREEMIDSLRQDLDFQKAIVDGADFAEENLRIVIDELTEKKNC